MKPEPCHLALKLLDADEPCGACGHAARTHRNHASYVDPDAKPAEPKPADEFDGWTPPMLRTAIAFERTTIAELRLELHREREQRQALERGIVEIRHAACAALTWATDSKPDVVNAQRAVDELARRLRDELAASRSDTAREATLIRERDAARGEAKALEGLRPALADARKELAELRAERERGYRAKPSIEVVGVVADRGTESAVLALAWARDPARTREEIESQIEKFEAMAIDSPGAGYAASVLRWVIASPNRRTSTDFDAARRAIDAGRELP